MGDTGDIAATPLEPLSASTNGNGAVHRDDVARIHTAGEMLEAAVVEAKDGDVGSFVGHDEPAEYSYDYALADRRAVDALRRVFEAEGATLDPEFEPGGDDLSQQLDESGVMIAPRPSEQGASDGASEKGISGGARDKIRDVISDRLRRRRRG